MTNSSLTPSQVRARIRNWRLSVLAAIIVLGLLGNINATVSNAASIVFLAVGIYFFLQMRKWRNTPEVQEILQGFKADKAAAAEAKQQRARAARQTRAVEAKYVVGLEKYNLQGTYTISSAESGLTLRKGSGKRAQATVIPWTELIEVQAGSESDLRSRVTLSRVLLVGVFALGMKKERKQEFYVSIATADSVGMFEMNTAIGNNQQHEAIARTFASACNARIRSANPVGVEKFERANSANYDEIERLGDLLSKGHLTQEEFDAKKRQILGL